MKHSEFMKHETCLCDDITGLIMKKICWNSLIRDPLTKRSGAIQALRSHRKLCLTGTPLQNHLSDLYTLLRFLRVDPWCREEVWQTFIKENIGRKSPRGIDLLQRLLATVSLRRLKSEVLRLPAKRERVVGLQLTQPWRDHYQKRYSNFAKTYGVDRASGSWDSTDFFQQLTMLQIYCNSPALIDAEKFDMPHRAITWRDSPKIVHLVSDLKRHLASDQNGKTPKAVIFSQWTEFLHK